VLVSEYQHLIYKAEELARPSFSLKTPALESDVDATWHPFVDL
jgi:hypothetical protein